MKLLVVGGSGYVGGLALPLLAKHHSIRVYDLVPPQDGPWQYVAGDVNDLDELARAVAETDALIYMAIGSRDDDGSFKSVAAARAAFDVSVKGLYFTLDAAHKAGCLHAVYTSSMSIYDGPVGQRSFADEELPPDAREVYGLTKHLGEEVCRYAVRAWDMSVNALRLCLPVSMEGWPAAHNDKANVYTSSDDMGRALLAALEYRNGFEAFMIGGDKNQARINLTKARRLLNWEPQAPNPTKMKSAALNFFRRLK
jgi:nucleoside-diphosphate-sugar epimerase